MTEFPHNSPVPDPNEQPGSPVQPEALALPEMQGAEAIMGMGAMATGMLVDSDVKGSGPGWLRRRWDGVKGAVKNFLHEANPFNSEAGQAIRDSGVQVSKWDTAKAVVRDMSKAVVAVPLMPAMVFADYYSTLWNGVRQKSQAPRLTPLEERAWEARRDTGLHNKTVTNKLGAALAKSDLRSSAANLVSNLPYPVREQVYQRARWENWKRENRARINAATVLGSAAAGALTDLAIKLAIHH